jgi:hypothetical protein
VHTPNEAGALDNPSQGIGDVGCDRTFGRGVNMNSRIKNGVQHNPLSN